MTTRKMVWWQSISWPTRVMIPSKKPSSPKAINGVLRRINASILRGNHDIVRANTKSSLRKGK